MGLFNTITTDCHLCGSKVKFQSKGGSCNLEEFDVQSAPIRDLAYIADEIETCPKCGARFKAIIIAHGFVIPLGRF